MSLYLSSYTLHYSRIYASIVFVLLFGLVQHVCAQGELPPISTYTYTEHGGGMQNCQIDQSEDRKVYVANNEGLLEYDGERWKLYPSVNQTLMRSVKKRNFT